MQPSKFRIWDRQNKCFIRNRTGLCAYDNWCITAFAGHLVNYMAVQDGDRSDKHFLCSNPHLYMDDKKVVEGERYVYQIETTLADRNGMPIFVGDILWSSQDEKHYEVVFHKGMFAVRFRDDTFSPLHEYLFDGAIVGNIFEHIKLLEIEL